MKNSDEKLATMAAVVVKHPSWTRSRKTCMDLVSIGISTTTLLFCLDYQLKPFCLYMTELFYYKGQFITLTFLFFGHHISL